MRLKVPYISYLFDKGLVNNRWVWDAFPVGTKNLSTGVRRTPSISKDEWEAYPWNPPGFLDKAWLEKTYGDGHTVWQHQFWRKLLGIDRDALLSLPAQADVMPKPTWPEMEQWNEIAVMHALNNRSSRRLTGSFEQVLDDWTDKVAAVDVPHESGKVIKGFAASKFSVLPVHPAPLPD